MSARRRALAALRGGAFALACASALPSALAAPATPPDSLYQLQLRLVDQSGRTTSFDRYRGQRVLVSMFYASCDRVCPALIRQLAQLDAGLDPAARARLRVLLVSLDPERDTPEALLALAERNRVDLARWSFARADAGDLRALAALLGVQYRKLPDGSFNHSTSVSLLDPEGRLLARSEALGRRDEGFAAALRKATAADP